MKIASLKRVCCLGVFGLVAFVFLGCSGKVSLATFNNAFYNNTYEDAYKIAKKGAKKSTLWKIQAGVSSLYAGGKDSKLKKRAEESNRLLDEASLNMGIQSAQFMADKGSLAHEVLNAGTLGIYTGHWYEASMIKYYQAINYLSMGGEKEANKAFTYLKQAKEMQRQALDEFKKAMKKAAAKLAKDAAKNKAKNPKAAAPTMQLNDIDKSGLGKYTSREEFSNQDSFINPEITYVHGLIYYARGDEGAAENELKKVGLLDKTRKTPLYTQVDDDIKAMQSGGKYTWVIIEEGKSPSMEQYVKNINFLTLDLSVTLPKFMQGQTLSALTYNGGQSLTKIADYNKIIGREYARLYPSIVAKQASLTVVKAIAQLAITAAAGKSGGVAGGLLGGLAGNLASKALQIPINTDLSTALPDATYVVRVANDEPLAIQRDGNKYIDINFGDKTSPVIDNEVTLNKNNNNILFIRTTTNKSTNNLKVLISK